MLTEFIQEVKPAIDAELRLAVTHPEFRSYPGLETILRYHLGLNGNGGEASDQGKRIRPLLVLLAGYAVSGNWQPAIPSAAAVELLHNFSLIHDDIEDKSEIRRGRETVWKKWGIPLAINAGDALYTLSYDELNKLCKTVNENAAYRSTQVLIDTCLHLTGGQHLDISFEKQHILSIDSYWDMISGKTAALISACLLLGAIAGNASVGSEKSLADFGRFLGLSFQVLDDWLGIWGETQKTGKSSASDLVLGKKTLPILYGVERGGRFAQRWIKGPIENNEVHELTDILIDEGAQAFTEAQAERLTEQALQSLKAAGCNNKGEEMLNELALSLLKREK